MRPSPLGLVRGIDCPIAISLCGQTAMCGALLLTAARGPTVWQTLLPLRAPAAAFQALQAVGLDWRGGAPLREVLGLWTVVVMVINGVSTTRMLWRHQATSPPPPTTSAASTSSDGPVAGARPQPPSPPCAGRAAMVRQLSFLAAHVTLTMLTYRAAVLAAPMQHAAPAARVAMMETPSGSGMALLRLLRLQATIGFAGDMARLLASRLGHLPLPRVSRCLVGGAAFCVGVHLWVRHPHPLIHGLLAAVVGAIATDALRFFVRAVRAIAACLGMHPLRVRSQRPH